MNLPIDQKEQFYSIASKSDEDMSAYEWFNHLVPTTLQNNPDEVRVFMDGDPSLGIPDRDVSRIQSGQNGGEYTSDNTIMENSSVNRSRGGDNMTDQEYKSAVNDNAADTQKIEDAFPEDDPEPLTLQQAADVTLAAEATSALAQVGELALDFVMPIVAGTTAAAHVAGKCDNTRDKLVYGGAAGGATLAIACTPVGQVAIAGYMTFKLGKLGVNTFKKVKKAYSN